MAQRVSGEARSVLIPVGHGRVLEGDLHVPPGARGVVIFAHGSGSGRGSPRNRMVAGRLRDFGGAATLLFDLLTREEDSVDQLTREHRFDIPLLAERLGYATDWIVADAATHGLPIGYFGASTGAAAALMAAAHFGDEEVRAVVSRGGRPDLAGSALPDVTQPTLLIVGEADEDVIELNRRAQSQMRRAIVELKIVPRATHLFEEPGALESVADLAAAWFHHHLVPPDRRPVEEPPHRAWFRP